VLKRWPDGAEGEPFFQKRAPLPAKSSGMAPREYAKVHFPSGRSADLLVPRSIEDILWMVQLNCLDLNPWPVRAEELDRPDELRVDLDPSPGVGFAEVREVAVVVRDVLEDHELTGWPKTSGSRGLHVFVRILPQWNFTEVRRAALALAREVERRRPGLATSKWWKEERHGVFIDYNQNARDRTVASAYSVRPTGLVSAPVTWDEVPDVELEDFPLDRFAQRHARVGDLTEGIDEAAGSLDALLELSERDEREGLGDAPWPPHFPKMAGEPPRVQPSRKRMPG
jgi:DNA ligase D-like protein (predicted polymerase)